MRFCLFLVAALLAAAAADDTSAEDDKVSFTKEVRIVFSDEEDVPQTRVLTGEEPVREGIVEDAKLGDVVQGKIKEPEQEVKEEKETKTAEGTDETEEEGEEVDDEEEFIIIDDTTRLAAEKLIHELDEISNKLKDDETIGTSRAISSADVSSLEKLLKTAGLTPDSPILKNLQQNLQTLQMAQNPSGAGSVPNLGGLGGLGALGNMGGMGGLAGGMGGMGGMAGLGGLLAPGMTKKNVEEIKAELKEMLFGPDQPKRTGEADRRQEPNKRRPLLGRNPRPPPKNRQPAPAPGRSPFTFGTNQAPAPGPSFAQRPVDRQPINEFRSPPSEFRIPETPFRSNVFNQPQPQQPTNDFRNTFIRPTNGQNVITPPPLRASQPQRPFNPSPLDRPTVIAAPRPTEEEFRPVLIGGNRQNVQSQPSQPVGVRQPAPQLTPQFQRPAAPPTQFQTPTQFLQPTVRLPPPQQPPVQQHAPAPSIPAQRQPFQPQPNQRNPPFQQAPPVQQFAPAQRTPQQPAQAPAARPPPFSAALPNINGIFSGTFDSTGSLSTSSASLATKNKFVPDCNLFAEGICLEVRNYPSELLANFLSRNRPTLDSMLAEVRSQSADDLTDGISAAEERKYSYSHYYGNRKQGEDTHAHRDFAEDGGFLCPSEVRYARPQLAQTSRGNWKYIVNMGEHTQTLRMERCLKPNDGCSYVSPHYKSHCIQVYNYHRLLSWDDKKGMHIDIYKIPVGCSCHIHGYAYLYPPLDGKTNGHIIPPAFNNLNDTAVKRKSSPNERQQTVNTRQRSDHTPSSRQPDEEDELVPPGFRDFHAFMNQQFGERVKFQPNAVKERKPNSNRRTDDAESVTYVDNPRPNRQKTNYDYHPIIDFFHDKHSSSVKS